MRPQYFTLVLLLAMLASSCRPMEQSLDDIAREYVLLSLQLNTHDDGYVDAYYGDPAWKAEAEASPASMPVIKERAVLLLKTLEEMADENASEPFSRRRYLQKGITSMIGRIDLLEGKKMSFDEEAIAIYDSRPPMYSEATFDSVLAKIDALVPGSGALTDRVQAFRDKFVIPAEKLDVVFQAAMDECRRRTKEHIKLPAEERFTIEYVQDKPWSAYNWFKGDAVSLIEFNTDSPTRIDSAVHTACHEGYPGHHVFSTLREKHYREDGWAEFSMLPLYAPIAPIAEGSANYAEKIAFPGDERIRYEKEVLFPLAGLNTAEANRYYELLSLTSSLAFARNEAARRYLSGEWDADITAAWLMKYQLVTEQRARQILRFIDTYRAYTLNYNYGEELVRRYIEDRAASPDEKWELFEELLAAPVVPSDLY